VAEVAGVRGKANAAASKGNNKKAGGQAALLDAAGLLDGEFDPEEWDARMSAAFGDDYYVSLQFAQLDCPVLMMSWSLNS
jgi:hypothetical protein